MENYDSTDTRLDAREAELAKSARLSLMKVLNFPATVNVTMVREDVGCYEAAPVLKLPVKVLRVFADLLEAMSHGQPVSILPQSTDVTTQEAARILNVSRPYLIKLLSEHKIPFHKLGKHRRIRLDDVLHYQAAQRAASLRAVLVERSALADTPDAVWHDADDVFNELGLGNAD